MKLYGGYSKKAKKQQAGRFAQDRQPEQSYQSQQPDLGNSPYQSQQPDLGNSPYQNQDWQPEVPAADTGKPKKKKKTALDRVIAVLMTLVVLEALYCTAVFSDIAFIAKWRTIWIQTAMSTATHQWLATAFIPGIVIDEAMDQVSAARQDQIGLESTWDVEEPEETETAQPEETEAQIPADEQAFYDLYWEIDPVEMREFVKDNPELIEKGWDKIYINEAGLDDDGLDLETTMGEQVLAIDVQNKTLVVRVEGSGYQGVLVIAKDPSKLSIRPAQYLGSYGEVAGDIGERHNGLVAMTANGFIDPNGNGNGGTLAGWTMMNGEEAGKHYPWGYKRLELHEDDRFYITDAESEVGEGTTDAVEFTPALIIDGELLVDEHNDWNGINPRACIGQSRKGEILMMVIEGRQTHSLGTGVSECGRIFMRHDCMQAMNLDGGTSAILWYDGEYVTRCSNAAIPYGRLLPNAFVYERTVK